MFMCVDREKHCGGEPNINTNQIHVFLLDKHIVPWQLSTSKLLFPHSEHSEERCRPQLHVPSPSRASRSIRLLFWMNHVIMRELWSMTNLLLISFYFFLSSIAIIFIHSVWYCILIWLLGPERFMYTPRTLSLFLSLCVSQCTPNRSSELNEENHFLREVKLYECGSPFSLES